MNKNEILASAIFGYFASQCRGAIDERLRGEANLFINFMRFDLAATKEMTLFHGQWILKTLYEISPEHHEQHISNLKKEGLDYQQYISNILAAADSSWDSIESTNRRSEATKTKLRSYMAESSKIIEHNKKRAGIFDFLQILTTLLAVPIYLIALHNLVITKRGSKNSTKSEFNCGTTKSD